MVFVQKYQILGADKYELSSKYWTTASLENIHEANKLIGFVHYTVADLVTSSPTHDSDWIFITPDLKAVFDRIKQERADEETKKYALAEELNKQPVIIKKWDFGDGYTAIMKRDGKAEYNPKMSSTVKQAIATDLFKDDKSISPLWCGFYVPSYISTFYLKDKRQVRVLKKQFKKDFDYAIQNEQVLNKIADALRDIYETYNGYHKKHQLYY